MVGRPVARKRRRIVGWNDGADRERNSRSAKEKCGISVALNSPMLLFAILSGLQLCSALIAPDNLDTRRTVQWQPNRKLSAIGEVCARNTFT